MNTRTIIKIIVGLAVAAFLLYNSVYITSLTEHNEQLKAQVFDPTQAIEHFWKEAPAELSEKAVELAAFDQLLAANPKELAEKYGRTLGISAPYSVLVKGTAEIAEHKDECITLRLESPVQYDIRTKSIFSNSMREASGFFDLDKFETTMDFNLIAIEINNRIVKDITIPVEAQLTPGTIVEFVGAADINLRKLPVKSVEIIPIVLKTVQP